MKNLILAAVAGASFLCGAASLPVVVPKDGILSERTAAAELCEYLGKITGVRQEPLTGDKAGLGPAIRLVADESMASEEWSIKADGDGSVVISGGRPRGVLYGAYHFLEDVLGVMWLSPVVESVPRRKELDFGKIDLHGKPAMPYRAIYLVPGASGQRFLARNRMNASMAEYGGFHRLIGGSSECHTLYSNLGDPDEVRRLFKEHPEWFPLINGKRYCHVERANAAAQSQLCLTNPELRRHWAEKLRERIRKDRAAAEKSGTDKPMYYAIDQNDCYDGFCTCGACKAIAEREGSNAGLLLDFANYVASELESEAPEARFQMMALHSTEKPPKTLVARHNVTIRLCDTTSNVIVPWTDEQNAKHLANLKAWMGHADAISMWDYQITFGSAPTRALPTPSERTFAADIRMLRDCRGDGVFFEHENSVSADMRDLKVWLECKLAENPDLDGEILIRKFTDAYYGPAAGAVIREYRAFLGRAADEAKARVSWFPSLSSYAFLTGAKVRDCYRFRDRALAAAKGDEELVARVEHAFFSLDRLYLVRSGVLSRRLARSNPGERLPDPAAVADRYRRVFEHEMKSRGYDEKMAEQKSAVDNLFSFVDKARDLPVPERFRNVPPDAFFLYPATFASTHYKPVSIADDPTTPVKRAVRVDMRLVRKYPHEYYPLSGYGWPLCGEVRPTMAGTWKTQIEGAPSTRPDGYRWYRIASDVPLKADSVVSVWRGFFLPLDGAVSDNSELGQKYDVWASIKVEGADVFKSGTVGMDTVYSLDQIAVVRKTVNAD